uniref:Uncharacterized protein n=1 Tax=Arundo donax TaxID=35708 RepID=A0A0A8Y4M6_ARUDO
MGNCLLMSCTRIFSRVTSSPKAPGDGHGHGHGKGQKDLSTEGVSSTAAPLRHPEDGSFVPPPPSSGVPLVGGEDAGKKLSSKENHALPRVPSQRPSDVVRVS